MARGIRRFPIFKRDEDYQIFMMIMKEIQAKKEFTLHCYCLMTNHFHIQVSTKDIEVWKLMQPLLNSYAKYFNKTYGYTGHLFENRYTSRLIENPIYFLEVSRYIHLNPVKAGMVRGPSDYEYSSYRTYIGELLPTLEDDEKVLSYFVNSSNPREEYRMFVEGDASHHEFEREIQTDMKEDDNWLPW